MNKPLTRADLDTMPCQNPGCAHDTCQMFFHGRCHPHADLEASYRKDHGTITIRCARCSMVVAVVKVAP